VKIEWLYEAQGEYRDYLNYHRTKVGTESARRFSQMILKAVRNLESFPEMGILREDRLTGKYGFRALFINQYVLIYKIDGDTIYIYHLTDARTYYIYHIFGIEADPE
jgi:plasmid stabilization system protein ParE